MWHKLTDIDIDNFYNNLIDYYNMTRTQKQAQAAAQHPKYAAYLESKSDYYVAKRYSLAYVLFSVANSYAEEANDRLAEYNLVHKKLKTTANNLMQSFDAYDKVMRAMLDPNSPANVNREDIGGQFCTDYDMIKKACDAFLNEHEQ